MVEAIYQAGRSVKLGISWDGSTRYLDSICRSPAENRIRHILPSENLLNSSNWTRLAPRGVG